MTLVEVWIENGRGLNILGFVLSTMHEIAEYSSSLVEWHVTAGIWALGLMRQIVALKIAIPVFTGGVQIEREELRSAE